MTSVDEQSIGPYRVIRRLGSGGMGEVYLAEDTRLKRNVALKRLTDPTIGSPEARQRLLREARAVAQMTHPNIAAVYDVTDAGGEPHIVMEFVEGTTLHTRLQNGRLSLEDVLPIIDQLASALTEAHGRGVVHLDLKPANISITPSGALKVLDFGIASIHASTAATATEQTTTAESIWDTHKVMGTPAYMAPEQLLRQPVDHRADIYSVGVILFQLLTGRLPFQSEDFLGLSLQVVSQPPPRLRDFAPEVPAAVESIVARALAKDATQRYQSIEELRAELRRAAESRDRPIEDDGSSSRPRSQGRWTTTARALLVVAALVAVMFAGRALVKFMSAPKPRPPGGPAVVAVVPFSNISGDPAKAHLGVGFAEALSTDLSRVQALTVISRSGSAEVQARPPDLGRLARSLGATYLVDGAVQQSGDRLRVTVKLLKPDSSVAWGEVFEGTASELFELQNTIVQRVISALDVADPSAVARAGRTSTSNADAFAEYSRGRALLDRVDVPGNVTAAIDAFGRAVAKDREFALAHAGLGDAYWAQYQETDDNRWTEPALRSITEALRIDPGQPEVRISLALVYHGTGRSEDAIQELRRALTLAPNNDYAHRLLGTVLRDTGSAAEALAEFKKAIELRPGYWRNHNLLAGFYYRTGRHEEALEAYRKVTELQPDNARGFLNLGTVYHKMGDTQKALENYKTAIRISPMAEAYSNIGNIEYDERRYSEAATSFEQAIALSPRNPLLHGNLGDVHARVGRHHAARQAYERAVDLSRKALEVNPRDAETLMNLALYEAKLGRKAAVGHAAEAVRRNPDDVEVLYTQAAVHALLDNQPAAIAALRKAIDRGYRRELVAKDEDFAKLRNNAAFRQLVGPV
ncbi:MAG: tetratricopeptide repeat protein [Acidobacteria bacterium]|nr:tetratricopeptide repeat protein [Acidobacteriota bacterium]